MSKDFDGWNAHKKQLESREARVFFHEREVWWCSLGVNLVFEQDGKNELYERPVLIIRKFNRDLFWALPLTRAIKSNRYYFPVTVGEKGSAVVLSQLRLLSSKRLQRHVYNLPKKQFSEITSLVREFLSDPEKIGTPPFGRGSSGA